jgi:hypothetical protein
MPYITQERRTPARTTPATAGELNYAITQLVLDYLSRNGERYQTFCEIEGVLGHVAKELYRRRVEPYEQLKLEVNGDVYE